MSPGGTVHTKNKTSKTTLNSYFFLVFKFLLSIFLHRISGTLLSYNPYSFPFCYLGPLIFQTMNSARSYSSI